MAGHRGSVMTHTLDKLLNVKPKHLITGFLNTHHQLTPYETQFIIYISPSLSTLLPSPTCLLFTALEVV